MASRSALLAVLVAVSCAAAASAASFTVGDAQGWTQGANYDTWASGKTFNVGDTLVFNFPANAHDVAVVDQSGYDGCSGSAASNTITNSPATVTLTTSGTHYYICTFPGHCSNGGMKLAVTVGSGSGSPSTPSTPGTPSTPPSTPSPRPSGASARLTAGPALAVAAGVLLKLAMF